MHREDRKVKLVQSIPIWAGAVDSEHPFPVDHLEIECKSHRVLARGPVNSISSNPRRATEGCPQEGKGAGRAAPSQLCPMSSLQSGFVQCLRLEAKYSLG